jgi:SRSO17 transposase
MEVVVSRMPTAVVPTARPATLPELAPSRAPFAPLFRRSTSRASVERSLTGLLTDLPRQHCDTIAAAVAGPSTERLHHLWTDAPWTPQALDQQRVTALVGQSPAQGILVLDDPGLPQPGRGSAGVARQYSGPLGKGAKCQIGVTVHAVADEPAPRAPGHWPRSARLSLPEAWASDRARRGTVPVPTAVALQRQPELALALVDQARAWGVPFAWGGADAGDGATPPFLHGLDARHVAYVVGVRSTFGVRLPDEVHTATLVLPSRPRRRGQPQTPRPAPRAAAKAVLAALPEDRWQPITWREHDHGVLRKQCVAVRLHWATGGAQLSPSQPRVYTGPEGWLLGERPLLGERGDLQWSCRTRPTDTPRHRLVALAHSRWPIEQCYEDAKGACGLDDSQGRRWDGWPRQLALVLLASSFVAWQRWMPTDPVGFSPLRGASVVPSSPSPSARVALPGGGVMADRHPSNHSLPPQADLTK